VTEGAEDVNVTFETIALVRAQEQLRQERDTFDSQMRQYKRNCLLRITMGWLAALLLPSIAAVCAWLVTQDDGVSARTQELATAALLVDVLGVVLSVWRGVVGSAPVAPVLPVTNGAVPDVAHPRPETTDRSA
jgi:hypothetical protein